MLEWGSNLPKLDGLYTISDIAIIDSHHGPPGPACWVNWRIPVTAFGSERAREWISRALAIDPDDPQYLYNVACGYTKLGDIELALDLLERSLPRSGPELQSWVKHDSDFDALRTHPRYRNLLDLIK